MLSKAELRYRVTSCLLRAGEPVSLRALTADCAVTEEALGPVLQSLIDEGLVVSGDLVKGRAGPQYCWAARWDELSQIASRGAQQALRKTVAAAPEEPLGVHSAASTAFHRYVIDEYEPPPGKPYLVILQCAVRRPFSSAPSHASMRRAIRVATGSDPRDDVAVCPAHVVVLASQIGPVPYELEDLHPANVRGGGVKGMDRSQYERVRPVLAGRMAEYIAAHGDRHAHVATFTQGRYGEVMRDAQALLADTGRGRPDLAILPRDGGAQVVRLGVSKPRTYWQRYWVQLTLEIAGWLPLAEQAGVRARLRAMGVVYRG